MAEAIKVESVQLLEYIVESGNSCTHPYRVSSSDIVKVYEVAPATSPHEKIAEGKLVNPIAGEISVGATVGGGGGGGGAETVKLQTDDQELVKRLFEAFTRQK